MEKKKEAAKQSLRKDFLFPLALFNRDRVGIP